MLALTPRRLLLLLSNAPSFVGVLNHFQGFNCVEIFFLLIAALLCFVFEFQKSRFVQNLENCAVIATGIALCMTLGVSRTLTDLMVTPLYQIAETIKKDGAIPGQCIRYSGTLSPTLSLALAPELIHNRCEPGNMIYLIAPEWKSKECQELNFKIIDQKSYLVLCKRG